MCLYIKISHLTKLARFEHALLFSIHDCAFCSPVTTLAFKSFPPGIDFPNTKCQKSVPSMPCVHTCGLYWRRNNVAVHDPWAGTFHCVTPSEASHPTVNPLPAPCLDPEECPRGPTEQTTTPANFGFSSKKKKYIYPSQPDIPLTMGLCYSSFHFIWEECVVFLL